MLCKDCNRYPFCSHIHKPSDEACDFAKKRKLESEIKRKSIKGVNYGNRSTGKYGKILKIFLIIK